MDGKVFPNGPGLSYSNAFFLGGEDYKGPYTDPGGFEAQQAVTVEGNTITVKMAKPFPDFAYYANFPAIGPIPTDPAVATRRSTPRSPCDRPVQDRPVHRRQVAHAGPQRPVGPGHGPGAHGVPGQLRVQGGPVG